MKKRNFEIENLFRYDPETNIYLYHLVETWTIDGEVHRINTWESIPEEVYDMLRKSEWREVKRVVRENRCWVPGKNGRLIRCPEGNKCQECPYIIKDIQGTLRPGERTGSLLSLDAFMEMGRDVPDPSNIEEQLETQELKEAIGKALQALDEEDYHIIILAGGGMSEKEIGQRVGKPQRTISDWIRKIRTQLKEALKDYL